MTRAAVRNELKGWERTDHGGETDSQVELQKARELVSEQGGKGGAVTPWTRKEAIASAPYELLLASRPRAW